ncbi:MAG: hypothetical protein ACKOEE_13925 [Tagaea sp.]|nr:hypothetical protein [Azospirillum sp.]MCA3267297.1 hypothetical protein [Azospirillum sp.]MCZ8124525.1 hypothetical protein [Magnetospirillum sp.]
MSASLEFRRGARSEIRTPAFAELLDWWLARRGDRRVLARADFHPEELARWWRHLSLFRVERPAELSRDRYKYAYHGLKPIEYDGGDFTGRYLDDVLPPRLYAAVAAVNGTACERLSPLYTFRVVDSRGGFPVGLERLLIPLSSDRIVADRLLVLANRHSAKDVAYSDIDAAGSAFVMDTLVAMAFD